MRNSDLSHHRAYRSVHGGIYCKIHNSSLTNICYSITRIGCNPCCILIYSEFYQVIYAVLRSFPLFPNAHAQSATNSCVHLFTKCFHTTYLEIVNPPSDKLIEFHHFITVANAPATARELFHSLLKFRY